MFADNDIAFQLAIIKALALFWVLGFLGSQFVLNNVFNSKDVK